jgi:Glycosyltransferase sugar-binding region containing DXD motif
MIPKIFHQSSKDFTWEERRLARRAQALMPEWEYHLWTDEDNLSLVKEIFPSAVPEYLKFPHGGARSDVARYLYMYQYGGIYFDTDFRFCQPINEDLLSNLCILGIEEEDAFELGGGPKLGNAFIGSQRGLALWPELVDSIFTRFRKGEHCDDGWYLSGPYALNTFLRHHKQYKEMVTMLPRTSLYPKLIKFNLTGARGPDTIGVHLCWSSWVSMSLPHKIKNRTRRILSALA